MKRRTASALGLALAIMSGVASPALAQPGGDDQPVSLSLAVADPAGRQSEAAVTDLVALVSDLSGGSFTITPVYGAADAADPAFEHGVAELVKAGDYDLAMIGARAWELAGIDSFRAFHAPFLIDNAALALAVAKSEVADRALASMGAGVTGLAMWPEHMRYLFSFPPSGSDLPDARRCQRRNDPRRRLATSSCLRRRAPRATVRRRGRQARLQR